MSEIPLNKFEKEKRVILLHLEGKTIRAIAPIVHMAFRDISKIIKTYDKKRLQNNKEANSQSNQKIKKPSISSQAFKLFIEGKKPTEVAIILDIQYEKVSKFYYQFLKLEKKFDCYEFYQECHHDLPTLLSINNFMKKNNFYGEDVANVLRQAKTIATLQLYETIESSS
jgi:transposase